MSDTSAATIDSTGLLTAGALADTVTVTATVQGQADSAAIRAVYRFTQLAVGNAYACGLSPVELSYCWGDNASGGLGDGTITNRSTPTLIAGQQ